MSETSSTEKCECLEGGDHPESKQKDVNGSENSNENKKQAVLQSPPVDKAEDEEKSMKPLTSKQRKQRNKEEQNRKKMEQYKAAEELRKHTVVMLEKLDMFFELMDSTKRLDNTLIISKKNVLGKLGGFFCSQSKEKNKKFNGWKKFLSARQEKCKTEPKIASIYNALNQLVGMEPEYKFKKYVIDTACFLFSGSNDVKQLEEKEKNFLKIIDYWNGTLLEAKFEPYFKSEKCHRENGPETQTDESRAMRKWKIDIPGVNNIQESYEKYNESEFFKERMAFHWENDADTYIIYEYLSLRLDPGCKYLDHDFYLLANCVPKDLLEHFESLFIATIYQT